MEKKETRHDGILSYCSCSPVLTEAESWDPLNFLLFTLDFALQKQIHFCFVSNIFCTEGT